MPEAPGHLCPICGKPAVQASRPFCSRRCADVDLNRWLSGVYTIPVTEDEEEDDAATKARTSATERAREGLVPVLDSRKSSHYNRGARAGRLRPR